MIGPAATLKAFLRSDSGAVTVDWVVLTAGIVGLGLSSAAAVQIGTSALGDSTNSSLSNATVAGNALLSTTFSGTDDMTFTGSYWYSYNEHAGWSTQTTDNRFEIIPSGYAGVENPTGNNMLDMGQSPGNTSMSRTLDDLATGSEHTVTFGAADIAGNNSVEVYFGGELLGTVTAERTMSEYSFTLTEGMGDGSNQLTFTETGVHDNNGTYLADITVH